MTECGHSFCESCIFSVCQEAYDWQCPVCNHVQNYPATDLARNYFAEQIIESFRAQPEPETRSIGEFGLCSVHQQDVTLCEFIKRFINSYFY